MKQRFTQFYNCAVCQPTRGALYTGLYPRDGGKERIGLTSGERLRAAGYLTGLFGKWGLSGRWGRQRPSERGFDETFAFLNTPRGYFRPKPAPGDTIPPAGTVDPIDENGKPIRAEDLPGDFYATDAFSNRAADAIRKAARSGQPFYFNLCYNAPHSPLHALPEDIARVRGRYRDGYDAIRAQRFRRQTELGLFAPHRASLTDTGLSTPLRGEHPFIKNYEIPAWERLVSEDRALYAERMEVYAAMVERMDRGIGRVLAALDETGLARNTAVFFLSDNGGSSEPSGATASGQMPVVPMGGPESNEMVGPGWALAQNTPFRRYKTWAYEGGICTPMIARWPAAIEPGRIIREAGHLVDFVPTFLELAGIGNPDTASDASVPPLEGRSLAPILRGGKPPPRSVPLAWELWGNRALREDRWKLVRTATARRWELFDLEMDRAETTDLAARFPARVAAMATQWDGWAKRTNPNGFTRMPPVRNRD